MFLVFTGCFTMNQVWLLFKILELIMGAFCMYQHIMGAIYHAEPLPHNLFFCGSFIGYIVVCVAGIYRLFNRMRTVEHREFLITSSGSLAHYICGFLSMYYAEQDFHLMYMAEKQELGHLYFAICKKQSIASMVTGTMYLLHALLILEIIIKMTYIADVNAFDADNQGAVGYEQDDNIAKNSANVYFLSKYVNDYLQNRFSWFKSLDDVEQRSSDQRNDRRKNPSAITSHTQAIEPSENHHIEVIELEEKTLRDV